MGLVSLIFLLVFTLLYASKSWEKKPELVVKALEKITANLDKLALWGAIYGLAAVVLTLLMKATGTEMLIRLAANVVIFLMALPLVFDRATAKFQEKMNPAIMNELKNFIGWLVRQEKVLGYIGIACSVLLFAIVFR